MFRRDKEDAVVSSKAPVAIEERAERCALVGAVMKEQTDLLRCPCQGYVPDVYDAVQTTRQEP